MMMMISFIQAQTKKKKDINSIKEMCGCFEVRFNFAETFINTDDEQYKPSKNHRSVGLEWAQLINEDKDMVSIQHILISLGQEETQIIKHWRQDWLYQNTEFYIYDHENKWNYVKKDKKQVKGQWTQKVFQVDDSPRYEGSGSWVHVDGKSYWENITFAPLPRREYSKRSDYNVTIRGNRQEITKNGWIHDQNNAKVIRKEGEEDQILAYEKGRNSYVKVDDSKCTSAAKWWDKNKVKWEHVRNKWAQLYSNNKTLSLKKSVNNTPLYRTLFYKDINQKNQIDSIIESYINKLF
ncbi:MAG: hypothetical protein HON33_03230 [Flavobacteriaceae bacterium]|nr:hypothetical protein [Flavobacteriaceae bacterium]